MGKTDEYPVNNGINMDNLEEGQKIDCNVKDCTERNECFKYFCDSCGNEEQYDEYLGDGFDCTFCRGGTMKFQGITCQLWVQAMKEREAKYPTRIPGRELTFDQKQKPDPRYIMKLKVKAMMEPLKDEPGHMIMEKIAQAARNAGCNFDDSVVELEITIKALNITELIGIDDEGCRAFRKVEIVVLEE